MSSQHEGGQNYMAFLWKIAGASESASTFSFPTITPTTRARVFTFTDAAFARVAYIEGTSSGSDTVNFPASTADKDALVWRMAWLNTSATSFDTLPSGTQIYASTQEGVWSSTVTTGAIAADSLAFTANKRNIGATLVIEDATAAPSSTTINVDIPLHINLKWDTTHQLAVTHDGGTTTLEGVTLSTPTGWETVAYSGSLPAGDSFASLAATDATLGGGGYTMQAGDTLAWETQTGLTVDVNTTPVVSPAATVSGSYKIWNEVGQTWTSASTFTINDLGEVVVGSGIPVADRVTFQAMVGYLITQGYQGAGNETIQKWLLAEGISKKSFNEMLSDYLSGLGYNGPLPKQLRDWRNE